MIKNRIKAPSEELAYLLDSEHVMMIADVDPDQRTPDELAWEVSNGAPRGGLLHSMAAASPADRALLQMALGQVARERGHDLDVFDIAEAYDAAVDLVASDVRFEDDDPTPGLPIMERAAGLIERAVQMVHGTGPLPAAA